MLRLALVASLGFASSGCSFVFVRRAPADVEDPTIVDRCTRSPAPPIVDTAVAVGAAFTALLMSYVAAIEEGFCGDAPECKSPELRGLVIGSAALAVGSTVSATYGYVATSHCRKHVKLGHRCAGGDLEACRALNPSWTPSAGWDAAPATPPDAASPPADERDADPWRAVPR